MMKDDFNSVVKLRLIKFLVDGRGEDNAVIFIHFRNSIFHIEHYTRDRELHVNVWIPAEDIVDMMIEPEGKNMVLTIQTTILVVHLEAQSGEALYVLRDRLNDLREEYPVLIYNERSFAWLEIDKPPYWALYATMIAIAVLFEIHDPTGKIVLIALPFIFAFFVIDGLRGALKYQKKWYNIITSYLDTRSHYLAKRWIVWIVRDHPDYNWEHFILSYILMEEHDFDEARDAAKRIMENTGMRDYMIERVDNYERIMNRAGLVRSVP